MQDAVRSILRQMGIEATEESASYLMNFAADWAANDPDAEFSFAELAEQALGGALSGGFYGTVGTLGGRALAGAQTAQTDVQQGQAGQRPFWQAEPVTGDVEAAAPVQGAQEAAANHAGTTVSSSGFILPEAKHQRIAQQDAAYSAQIDNVFNGNLPTDRVVGIGDTPDILLSLGATDLPMTMTQSTARKIAFPAGYQGGSHNLGIPALKHLPEQLRDPAAVLRSKTQPDSFVVLTEWNDTNGNPVIIALHLDKQGVVDITNEVASAYGKNNFAALTGENGENVLYTKNNKSIDQILDNRLQLPALLSDDTLVAYSIAQEGEEGNPAQADSQALGQTYTGLDDFAAPLTQTLVKIDEQMRIAENLPAGPARENRIQALRQDRRGRTAYRRCRKERRMYLDSLRRLRTTGRNSRAHRQSRNGLARNSRWQTLERLSANMKTGLLQSTHAP